MKRFMMTLMVFSAALFITAPVNADQGAKDANQTALDGAWSFTAGDVVHTAVFVDGYFSHSTFDVKNKQFMGTRGGPYQLDGNDLSIVWQYDTELAAQEVNPETWVGKTTNFSINQNDGQVIRILINGMETQWNKIGTNDGPLAGVWRMTGRKQGDNISTTPLRDRRTLKILTGDRFQWVAINIQTGAFSGTGGGTYTYENGKYTENIEFFSRDNSRVGASLEFDGVMQDGTWHHSGLSSAGNPIYEIWGKLEK